MRSKYGLPEPARDARRVLLVRTQVPVVRERVFPAWADPRVLARWWSPCPPARHPLPEWNGRAWRIGIRAPEGDEHRVQVTYQDIVSPERILFTFAWENGDGSVERETRVSARFAARHGYTQITVRHWGFASVAARLSHEDGWHESLDRLVHQLNNPRVSPPRDVSGTAAELQLLN